MKTIPYFYFNGNAAEALEFYTKIFKAESPHVMLFKDMPGADLSSPFADKILHAGITLDSDVYYVSDAVGKNEVTIGNNLQINLNFDSEGELRRIFTGLSENGTITMPLEDTFWGAVFGSLTDQFGISWTLNFQKSVADNS